MRSLGAITFVAWVTLAACAARPLDEPRHASNGVDAATPIEIADASTPIDIADASTPPPPLVAGADTPRGPKLRVRRLPPIDGCEVDVALARLGASCRRLPVTAVEGTGPGSKIDRPERAFDGNRCSHWNAGAFPPQAVRGAITDPAPITGVLLVPEMSPSGNATHVIELGPKDVFVAEATWTSEALHLVAFDRPVSTASITVRSTASPSWIAWREIVPFTCAALEIPAEATEESPKTPRPTPATPPEFARLGKGTCNVDADCVPAACCHPKTCAAVALAPRCESVGCAQNVVPETIGHGARCACIRGRCGAMVRDTHRGLL